MRTFRVHFNRINVQRGDPDIWTVHLSDQCIQTRHVDIRVPVSTVYKGATARQPRAYFKGKANHIIVYPKRVVIYGQES